MLDFRFLHPFEIKDSGEVEGVKIGVAWDRRVFKCWWAFHERHRLRNLHGGDGRTRSSDDTRGADRSTRDGTGESGEDGGNKCHHWIKLRNEVSTESSSAGGCC